MADKDPTIPFYAQDFYMDTIQLPEHLVGAYIRLLCSLWVNKFCYYDAKALAMVSPSAKEVVDLLKDKFIFNGNNTFTSKRLEEVREKRRIIREVRTNAGILGSQSRWQKDSKGDNKKMTKEIVIETEIERVISNNFPSKEDVLFYFTESGYSKEMGESFFSYYDAQEWRTTGGANIAKRWQSKVQGWINNQKGFSKNISQKKEPEKHYKTTEQLKQDLYGKR